MTAPTIEQTDERVTSTLQSWIDRFNYVKAEFVASFDENPAYAIQWQSVRIVAAQAHYVVALDLLDLRKGVTLADAVTGMVKQLEREIRMAHGSGRSTSAYSNANADYDAEAKVKILETLERYADQYAEAVA